MKGLSDIQNENTRAVALFDDVIRKAHTLATCSPADLKDTLNGLITCLIAHKNFNHDYEGSRVLGRLYLA